jgi:hypothetical protein
MDPGLRRDDEKREAGKPCVTFVLAHCNSVNKRCHLKIISPHTDRAIRFLENFFCIKPLEKTALETRRGNSTSSSRRIYCHAHGTTHWARI